MLGQWRQNLIAYFRINLVLYFFIILLFVIGVVFGALAVKTLNDDQKTELLTYLRVFFQGLAKGESSGLATGALVKQAIINNAKTIAAMWLLGATVIGVPVILFIIFTRGFVIGFTVGFLVNEYIFRGIVFALASILPQNLLVIPAIIITGVSAVSFTTLILKSRVRRHNINLYYEFAGYTLLVVLMLGLVVVAGLIEAYITPVFMKLVSALLLKE